MNRPRRKQIPHEPPQWVDERSFYFITVNCIPCGHNQLCVSPTGNKVLEAAAYNHENSVWHCRLVLLMPDHLHGIIAFPRDPGMQTIVRNWKKYLATESGIRWQREFFDHRLRDQREIDEKTEYILMNPVRKGLCQSPEDWPWVYRPNDRLFLIRD